MLPKQRKTHQGTLFALFFGRAWDQMAQNDQKCIFRTKFGLFGPKILILTGGSKSFGTHVTEKPHRHNVCIISWSAIGPNRPKCQYLAKKANYGLNLAVNGPKILIFMGVSKNIGTHISHNGKATLATCSNF